MKTDALFYQLFQTVPSLFFKLTGLVYAESYQFQAVELKQTAFRLDGIFVPKETELPIIFVEVQFQKDPTFYGRFFSEIMLYLYQQQPKQTHWQAVAIFPHRNLDNSSLIYYEPLIPRLQQIYLEEVLSQNQVNELSLLSMIISNETQAVAIANDLLQQQLYQNDKFLLNLIETLLLAKLPKTTREEIRKMINMAHVDITRTSWYQEGKLDGKLEGKQEQAQTLMLRLLTKRFGTLTKTILKSINQLSLGELERLTDDFLSLKSLEDLKQWLANKPQH